MERSFLDSYLLEQSLIQHASEEVFTEDSATGDSLSAISNKLPTPPPVPLIGRLREDAKNNYKTLRDNPQYGLTGLMAMTTWMDPATGDTVKVGDIFLFPGTHNSNASPYIGFVYLNGEFHSPLYSPNSGPALHKLMCTALGLPTTNFVGFAIAKTPWFTPFEPRNTIYRSCTCNPYWFGPGNCSITSIESGSANWGMLVWRTLKLAL